MEVGTRVCSAHVRHLPSANPVRVGDDPAVRRLPEHFGEAHDRHDAALDQVLKHRARPHGRKLVHVADQNQPGAVRNSPHEGVHQRHVHHRGFVHDQKTASERVRFVPAEPPSCGVDLQQAVDRLRFQARGLGEPLRRPSGRGAQQALHALGTQDHQDRVHQRRLAHARSSRDDHDPVRQNRLQRLALAGGERLARLPLAPRDRLVEINRRIEGCHPAKALDLCRDALFRLPQVRQEDQRLAVDLLQQQRPTREHLRQRLLDCGFRHFQQLHRRELEFPQRQGTVSVRSRFQQDMVDARPCPVERVSRNPDLLRDLVGGREADPVDVFRQHVGIAPHLLDCLLAIGLEDSHRPAGAHAVAVQEQHDLADLLCLLPRMRDSLPALGADAVHRLQFGGSVFDHGENLGSEPPDQLLRENRSDALSPSRCRGIARSPRLWSAAPSSWWSP